MNKASQQDNRPDFEPDVLSFIPLGGSGEFGCNLNAYHYNGKFLIVDCGIGFPDENMPGVDTLLPDPGFLRDVNKDIVGMVITHAHDDHKGAIAALWPQLNCPIYATPFTAELIRQKLREWDLAKRVTIHEVPLASTIDLSPFKVELIDTAHSVVESNMLLIKTPAGKVLHTGDWRIDDHPVEGRSTNDKRLKELSGENILALVGDSTNSVVESRHPSERELLDPLTDVFKKAPGRVIVTTFSHSIPRMRSVFDAATKAGRVVAMIGRSMLNAQEVARKTGYLQDVPQFLREKEIGTIDPRKVVILATGSQGEPGSAIDRLALDEHPSVSLDAGDLIVFSAREIPGNEKAIEKIRNRFLRRGIETILPDDAFVHASGHAYADEMRDLFHWVKPLSLVAVHGSETQQLAYAKIAAECDVPYQYIPANGDIIALRDDGPEKTGQVVSGLMAVDGVRVVPMKDSPMIKERNRVANDGSIVVTVVVDDEGYLLHDPIFSIAGLGADEEDAYDIEDMLLADIETAVSKADPADRNNAEALREVIRLAIRRRIKQELGKRPLLNVHLVQLS